MADVLLWPVRAGCRLLAWWLRSCLASLGFLIGLAFIVGVCIAAVVATSAVQP